MPCSYPSSSRTSLALTLAQRSSFRHCPSIPCLHRPRAFLSARADMTSGKSAKSAAKTAGKSTKSAAKDSKLAAKKRLAVKINEGDKWKPRTDSMKERQRPAPQLPCTASWFGALFLFKQDYLNEFREKNPKDKSSRDAVLRKASNVWNRLSNSDKAPYEARALAAAIQYRKDVAKTAFSRKTQDLKLKLEVEMEKMNL